MNRLRGNDIGGKEVNVFGDGYLFIAKDNLSVCVHIVVKAIAAVGVRLLKEVVTTGLTLIDAESVAMSDVSPIDDVLSIIEGDDMCLFAKDGVVVSVFEGLHRPIIWLTFDSASPT